MSPDPIEVDIRRQAAEVAERLARLQGDASQLRQDARRQLAFPATVLAAGTTALGLFLWLRPRRGRRGRRVLAKPRRLRAALSSATAVALRGWSLIQAWSTLGASQQRKPSPPDAAADLPADQL